MREVFTWTQLHVIVGIVTVSWSKIPDYIRVCKQNDPNLSQCIIDSVNTLRPYLRNGIPELEVPALEPLILDKIEIGSNGGGIGATLKDLHIYGPSNFIINDLRVNVPKNTFKFNVTVPELRVRGMYETDTRVLVLRLRGEGPANINLTDYSFECKLKGHKLQRDDKEYLEFDRMKVKVKVGSSQVRLENLFNGDKILGRATNLAINDNVDVFIEEIMPNLQKALSDKFTTIANKITTRFTYDELFPLS